MRTRPGAWTSGGTGCSRCTRPWWPTNLDKEDVERAPPQVKNHKNIIPVYYDIELSDDGEIEQIGARTDEGYTFQRPHQDQRQDE